MTVFNAISFFEIIWNQRISLFEKKRMYYKCPTISIKKIRFCFFFHRRSSFDSQQERNLCTVNLQITEKRDNMLRKIYQYIKKKEEEKYAVASLARKKKCVEKY